MAAWTSLPALLTRTSMPPNAATAAADERGRVGLDRDVRPTRDHAPGGVRELRGERLQPVQPAARRDDVSAPAGQQANRVRAQPAGRAR